MRKIILLVTLAAALAGCTFQTFVAGLQTDEAKAAAIIQKIRAGEAVVLSDVQYASDAICTKLGSADDALIAVRSQVGPAPGPRTSALLNTAGAALSGVTTYCAGSRGTSKQVLLSAWAGVQAAITALNSASAAAGQ